MRAARLHAYGKPLVLEEIATPEPRAGEVVVRVLGAGFCHTDIHVIDGEIRLLPKLPVVLGHENAGVVAHVGSGVRSVKEGDAVVVFGGWGCGHCGYCARGEEAICEAPEWVGLSQHDGGYAEYLRVPNERHLIRLSKLDPRAAAPLTDAALTPYRAIRRALPHLDPESSVLLIGLGGLGQYGLKLLRLMCPSPIIVVDVTEEKLRLAHELGAANALLAGPDLVDRIRDATSGRGVCAAFDFVGSDATLAAAIASTRSLGKVTQIGLAGGAARLRVLENARFEVSFETTLWGSLKELREVIALAESGRLAPIPIEYAPLDEINNVYQRVKQRQVTGRIVISP